MKDNLQAEIASCRIFEEVRIKVDDWMDYYNNDRYQWDLLKLSPKEYYQYLQTGIYPLPVYDPKTKQHCWGLTRWFPRGSRADPRNTKKRQYVLHCLPQTRHGARVAPQRCTILHIGKAVAV